MHNKGFRKASVEFHETVVVEGTETIDSSDNPFYAQIEGEWVHLVTDNTGPTTTVHTVPMAAIKSISWAWPYTPPEE